MEVPRETVSSSAAQLFGDAGLATAEAYAEALATTGVERGLIGPREVPRLWERHLLNCVVLQELIPARAELADVGSGAGLPGLPLAIARPDLSVSLIEPLLRRVIWLTEIVPSLGLTNVEVIRGRANAVIESGQRFDVVTARAVLPLPGLLALCLPLLRAGGQLLAMKGDGAEGELLEADDVLKNLGASEWSVMLCGEGQLEIPTKVVRVIAGPPPRTRQAAQVKSSKSSRAPQPKSSPRSTDLVTGKRSPRSTSRPLDAAGSSANGEASRTAQPSRADGADGSRGAVRSSRVSKSSGVGKSPGSGGLSGAGRSSTAGKPSGPDRSSDTAPPRSGKGRSSRAQESSDDGKLSGASRPTGPGKPTGTGEPRRHP